MVCSAPRSAPPAAASRRADRATSRPLTRSTACLLLLLVGALGACKSMPGDRSRGRRVTTAAPSSANPVVETELRRLERAEDPAAVLAYVERTEGGVDSAVTRARLDLAAARAQMELDREFLALTRFKSAYAELAPSTSGLANDVLLEWGDAEMAMGQHRDAIRHYEQALASGDTGRARARRLSCSLVVAYTAAGRTGDAEDQRRRLDLDGRQMLASVEARLMAGARAERRPVTHVPSRGLARGIIPRDPALLLPEIHTRREWGARPIGSDHVPMTLITSMTVHHSALPAPTAAQVGRHVNGIQVQHKDVNGWADIGYHFLVDPQGGIWEGRALVHQGAHAGGAANIGNIGICLLGDFDQQPVPPNQMRGLDRLVSRLREQFALGPEAVKTHREWKATACPGGHLHRAVMAYRSGARSTLALQ